MGFFETIAGPALNIANTLIGVHAAKKENARERDFNAEEAQLNRDFQREERLATQEYNSASAQIQRMMDAGINPIVGIGDGYPSATSTPMSGSQATYSSSLGSSILTAASQQALNIAQIDKLQADTDNVKEHTKNITPKTKAEIAKLFSDIGVNDFNKDLQEKTFGLYQSKTDAEIKVMNEQLNNLRNQSLEILKNVELKDAQIAGQQATTKLTNAQVENTQADTQGKEIGNELQQLMLDYSSITGIPVGTPECHALFTLWAQGRMTDISDKLALNTAQSDNSINKAAGMAGVVVNKIGRALSNLTENIGQIFTK